MSSFGVVPKTYSSLHPAGEVMGLPDQPRRRLMGFHRVGRTRYDALSLSQVTPTLKDIGKSERWRRPQEPGTRGQKMAKRETTVSVESLHGIAVLYEGDVHEVACLLLKLWAAKDRETNARRTGAVVRSMPTVGGLAMAYSSLVLNVTTERVKEVLVRHGLPLGATVEHDEAVQSEPPAGLRLAEVTSRPRARRKPPGQ